MKVTEVKTTPIPNGGKTVALCSVTLEDSFVVTGIKLMHGPKGLWVSMPQRMDKRTNKWMDICFPKTSPLRAAIRDAVIQNHNQYPQGNGNYGQPSPALQQPPQQNVFTPGPAPDYNLVWGPPIQSPNGTYQQADPTQEFINAWNQNQAAVQSQGLTYYESPQGWKVFKKV